MSNAAARGGGGGGAVTVDSLFQRQRQQQEEQHQQKTKKKRFSFANRNLSNLSSDAANEEEEAAADIDGELVATAAGDEHRKDGGDGAIDDSETESDDASKSANKKKLSGPKGSAVLKKTASASSASSDSDSAKRKRKKKEKPSKSEEAKPNAKKVEQLCALYPAASPSSLKQLLLDNKGSLTACVDALVAQNAAAANGFDESSNDSKASGDASKKRPSEAHSLKEPAKKKSRRILDSDDDDEEEASKNGVAEEEEDEDNSKTSSTVSSCLSSLAAADAAADDEEEPTTSKAAAASSGKTKRACFKSSSDDEEEAASAKKSKDKKKKKKDKKEKKKKRRALDDDDEAEDDGDGEFDQNMGGSGDSDEEPEEFISAEHQASILALFNEASIEDIQSMINVTLNRIKTLVSLRPFASFKDLQQRLTSKSLFTTINQAKEVIYARSEVATLLGKCKSISERLEAKVAALVNSRENSSDGESAASALEIKYQPKILNACLSLKPYQLIGLNWLCLMHREKINGILADEMGLGKTCQTIAFLSHLLELERKQQQHRGSGSTHMHLIIVPPSTLDNWVREITTWCPDFVFTVYQGNLDERRQMRQDVLLNAFEQPLNAILTTYGLIASTPEDKAFFRKVQFEYCVFDEAHMLKNMNSIRYQSLIKIRSRRKLLLTGTPMQNNLVELMSLLFFVMPDVFHNKEQYLTKIFTSKPRNESEDTFYNDKIQQAKGIMKPFFLRRLKTDVLKQLPKKSEEIFLCDMTQTQSHDYQDLISHYKKRKDAILLDLKAAAADDKKSSALEKQLDALKESKVVNKQKRDIVAQLDAGQADSSSSHILMELRKAANHPLLRRRLYDNEKIKKMARLVTNESSSDTVFEYVLEDMSIMSDFQLHKLCPLYRCLKGYELKEKDLLNSGKFTILSSLLADKKEQGDRCLIFSQFVILLDVLEEYLKLKNYRYCRLDGSTAVNERQDLIDSYNNNPDIFIFILSTKAGGMGINLAAANVVIMHDIDYNPFNDKQAEDRCHRVGQTREVQVYKLISKNSIDETMLKIQQRKIELGADVSGENDADQIKKVDMVSMLKEALNI